MSEQTITLLIVDDDAEIRNLLDQLLTKYGYQVLTAGDGRDMFAVLEDNTVDLILLDVMLPGEDGFSLCQKLRQTVSIPIIMVTAIGETTDRIVGLEMGADDYLTKPFNPRELVARIKAVTRRSQGQPATTVPDIDEGAACFKFNKWYLRVDERVLLSPDGLEVSLSTGEFELLKAFLLRPQKVLSRDQLLDYTKNRSAVPFDRSVDIQVSRLRSKLEEDPKKPQLIKTVRGGGYMLAMKVEKTQHAN